MQSLIIAGNVLADLLKPDFDRGKLFWKPRTPEMFTSPSKRYPEYRAQNWNRKYAGTEAFTALDGHGYLMGRIWGRAHKAHRVIWFLAHGEWPEGQIDHINGVRTDNRLANLRDVSQSDNNRNLAMRSDNASGQVGVCFDKSRGRWMAYANRLHIGRFDTFDAAVSARKSAEKNFSFTERHGKCSH